MDDSFSIIAAIIIIAAMFILPKFFTLRQRAISGLILFVVGWSGVFGGLALSDQPFLQSEKVAYVWVSTFVIGLILSVTLLVPACGELVGNWFSRRLKK